MPMKTTNVFVSYSHRDEDLVKPVVQLLRANQSLVFQDIDSIQPGKKWRDEIAKGIAESHLVIVFWCDHANASEEVEKEWKTAIELRKDLLPLLLDATPLPPQLAAFQWIDFQDAVGANHMLMTELFGSSVGSAAEPIEDLSYTNDYSEVDQVQSEPYGFWKTLTRGVGVVIGIAGLFALGMFISTWEVTNRLWFAVFIVFAGGLAYLWRSRLITSTQITLGVPGGTTTHEPKDFYKSSKPTSEILLGSPSSEHVDFDSMTLSLAGQIEVEIVRRTEIGQDAQMPPPISSQG